MPKKFTILSALTALSISTVGAVVPTFADGTTTYQVPDLVPLHAPFARDMVAECGEYNNDDAYWNCFDRVTSRYRERHGGLFESMYQLDYNGRMIVTGLNPTAGTLRFYLDETRGFQGDAFTFENVVIFWVDYYAANNPAWNESVGWDFVDNYLATGEVPQGYHVLYSGNRNDADWAVNTEVRMLYNQETNKPEEVVYNNSYGFIHVYGYDTEGNRHLENNYPGTCINGDLLYGGECRLEYVYNGSYASLNYVTAAATPEDETIIELKQALKDKADAEARVAEIEADLAETETALAEIEASLTEANMARAEAEMARTEAEMALADAQMALSDVQATLLNTQSELADATARAETAENNCRDLEARIAELEAIIASYQTIIRETEEKLTTTETALRNAEARATEAETRVTKAETRTAEAEAKLKEAEAKLKDALARAEAAEANPNIVTVYKTIEKIVKDSSSDTAIAQTAPQTITETSEQKSETEKTTDEYVELPTAGKEDEHTFPWWIIVFGITGIALILWWFVPNSRHRDE